jgi:hypothetical protein
MRRDHLRFLAGMRACRQQHEAAGDAAPRPRNLGWFGGRRRRIELQVAGDHHPTGAEGAETLRIGRRLGKA